MDMGWNARLLGLFEKDPNPPQYHHNNITLKHAVRLQRKFFVLADFAQIGSGHGHDARGSAKSGRQNLARSSPTCAPSWAYMYGHPGKEAALFSWASEDRRRDEWNHECLSLPWYLLHFDTHRKLQHISCRELNLLYSSPPGRFYEWLSTVPGLRLGRVPRRRRLERFSFTYKFLFILYFRRPKKSQPSRSYFFVLQFSPQCRATKRYRVGVPETQAVLPAKES